MGASCGGPVSLLCSQNAQSVRASSRVGPLPCSRNARPQKALVGRAQSEQTNPHSQGKKWKKKTKKVLAAGKRRVSARPGWAGENERAVERRPGHRSQGEKSQPKKKSKADGPLLRPVGFNASPRSVGYAGRDCPNFFARLFARHLAIREKASSAFSRPL